eukprot:scaffold1199_cov159-Isochrysis_galbana.AAC.5
MLHEEDAKDQLSALAGSGRARLTYDVYAWTRGRCISLSSTTRVPHRSFPALPNPPAQDRSAAQGPTKAPARGLRSRPEY